MMNRTSILATLLLSVSVLACNSGGSDTEAAPEEATTTEATALEIDLPAAPASQPGTQPMDHNGMAGRQAPSGTPMGHATQQGSGAMMGTLATEGEYNPEDVASQPGASEGALVNCPVDNRVFTIVDDSPHVTHEGEELYFCCTNCLRNFQSNPSNYLENIH